MCRRRSSKVSCWAVSQSKYRPPSGFRPQEGVQLQEGPDGSLHLHAIAGHETTNEDAVAEIRVPDHGLANRIAGIVDDRFLGHLHPFIVDRHPIPTGFVAFPGRAMSVGDVAARYASWAANALEPRADIIRDIGVLAVVECPDRRGQHTDTDEHKYPHAQAPPYACSNSNKIRPGLKPERIFVSVFYRVLLDDLNDAACARIDQHDTVVHVGVTVTRHVVVGWNVIVGDATFR